MQSMPQGEVTEAQAWARARELSHTTYPLTVVDSSANSGLNAGYWALAVIHGPGVQSATVCAADGREVGGTCYDRVVR